MHVTYIERSPGTWRLRIESGRDANGERKFSYETVKGTADDAARRRFEILQAHEQGTWAKPDKLLFGEYLDRWLEQRFALGVIRRSTKENLARYLGNYVKPTLGGLRLQAVTGAHIQALYTKLATQPTARRERLKGSTLRDVHGKLVKAFKDARRAKLIKVNPMEEVEPPPIAKSRRPKALEEADVPVLLEKIQGRWFEEPALAALGAGIRRGEVCGARWKDLSRDGRKLTVNGQLVQYQDGTVEWTETKTEAGKRTIALPPEVTDMLLRRRRAAAERHMAAGLGSIDDAYIFTRDGGEPIKPNSLSDAFNEFCDGHGLAAFTFHGTRHTHATMLLRRVGKEGAKAVSQRLGHADVTVTLEVYQSVFESDDTELGDMASGIFGKIGRGANKR